MSWRIFKEDMIAPLYVGAVGSLNGAGNQKTINLRNYIDTSGPHKLSFGIRCVQADTTGTAAFCQMRVQYETPNGQLRTIDPGAADLTAIADSLGAMWYADFVTVIDKRYPLGNGPGADPYGTFQLLFNCGAPGDALIAYECIIETYDDSPNGAFIP